MLDIRVVEGEAAAALAPAVWSVYDAVFGDHAGVEDWRSGMFDPHRRRDGFRLATAHQDGELIGFAWSYLGRRGQYWSDWVARTLPADVVAAWVGGHREVVSVGVLPERQGSGVGGRLLDAVLAPDDRVALLSTEVSPGSRAVRLYASRGWRPLGLLTPEIQVMGWRG